MFASVTQNIVITFDCCLHRLQDSLLVTGVAFKKTFSYAGFEMQPKKYVNPKLALLNVELELKAEKDNAEVRLDSVEVCTLVLKQMNKFIYLSVC